MNTKKVTEKVKKICKKYHIRLTQNKNGKRIKRSLSVLLKLIKKKRKKNSKKRKGLNKKKFRFGLKQEQPEESEEPDEFDLGLPVQKKSFLTRSREKVIGGAKSLGGAIKRNPIKATVAGLAIVGAAAVTAASGGLLGPAAAGMVASGLTTASAAVGSSAATIAAAAGPAISVVKGVGGKVAGVVSKAGGKALDAGGKALDAGGKALDAVEKVKSVTGKLPKQVTDKVSNAAAEQVANLVGNSNEPTGNVGEEKVGEENLENLEKAADGKTPTLNQIRAGRFGRSVRPRRRRISKKQAINILRRLLRKR